MIINKIVLLNFSKAMGHSNVHKEFCLVPVMLSTKGYMRAQRKRAHSDRAGKPQSPTLSTWKLSFLLTQEHRQLIGNKLWIVCDRLHHYCQLCCPLPVIRIIHPNLCHVISIDWPNFPIPLLWDWPYELMGLMSISERLSRNCVLWVFNQDLSGGNTNTKIIRNKMLL